MRTAMSEHCARRRSSESDCRPRASRRLAEHDEWRGGTVLQDAARGHMAGHGAGHDAQLRMDDSAILHDLYERNAALPEADLYPRTDAILNAYRLAEMFDPAMAARGPNPMGLWDHHLLRETVEDGFLQDVQWYHYSVTH